MPMADHERVDAAPTPFPGESSMIDTAPALDDLEAQAASFRANSFVVLPGLLSPEQVAALNEAIDRDRRQNPFMWFCETQRDYNCNLLLTEPAFEITIRQPVLLPL